MPGMNRALGLFPALREGEKREKENDNDQVKNNSPRNWENYSEKSSGSNIQTQKQKPLRVSLNKLFENGP